MRIPVVLVALSLVLSLPAVARNVRSSKAKIRDGEGGESRSRRRAREGFRQGQADSRRSCRGSTARWCGRSRRSPPTTSSPRWTVDASTGDVVDSEPKKVITGQSAFQTLRSGRPVTSTRPASPASATPWSAGAYGCIPGGGTCRVSEQCEIELVRPPRQREHLLSPCVAG